LFEAKVIGDPYYGLNDFNLRWVALANWTYSTTLNVPKYGSSSWLLFNGLDTFSSIELCGQHVASTNNQFRQYRFDVTRILDGCKTTPTLSVNFGSAAKIAERIANEPGQESKSQLLECSFCN
jgi:beta-mannosidase